MFKGLLYIAIITTAVVISWIGFSIYHTQTTSTISSDTSIRITPIEPKFDQETIDTLKLKKAVRANLSENKPGLTVTPGAQNESLSVSSQSGQSGL